MGATSSFWAATYECVQRLFLFSPVINIADFGLIQLVSCLSVFIGDSELVEIVSRHIGKNRFFLLKK